MKLQHHQEQLNKLRLNFSDQKKFKWTQLRARGIKLVDDITNIRWRLWSNKAAFLGPHSDKVWVDSHKITN